MAELTATEVLKLIVKPGIMILWYVTDADAGLLDTMQSITFLIKSVATAC